MEDNYVFKIADNEAEYQMIAQLNYETFVEEIPQHQKNSQQSLVDKFHTENTYFICLDDERKLVGMATLRDKRPFSLDIKLQNLDQYFPQSSKIVEARLLSVKKEYRSSKVAMKIMIMMAEYFVKHNYDILIVSGILNQVKLYEKLGFRSFGPVVGTGDALFQPMYLTQEFGRLHCHDLVKGNVSSLPAGKSINFLPGPVSHVHSVEEALAVKAISHRALDYKLLLGRVKWNLKKLSNAKNVELFIGSGTLVNDVVAAQLGQLDEKGLILKNGEFGNRLCQNANGFSLNYDTFSADFGFEFDFDKLDEHLKNNSDIKWLWFVNFETSAGIVNNAEKIVAIAKKYGVKVCADCISSLGNFPVDMSEFYLASSVGGKGLLAYTGVSMVFYNHEVAEPTKPIPTYFNLWKYIQSDGIPYSGNSNLMRALAQALEIMNPEKRFGQIREVFEWTRNELRKMNLHIVNDGDAGNVLLTIKLPSDLNSMEIGERMEFANYKLHYRSSFLQNNNILQIAFMSQDSLVKSPEFIEKFKSALYTRNN